MMRRTFVVLACEIRRRINVNFGETVRSGSAPPTWGAVVVHKVPKPSVQRLLNCAPRSQPSGMNMTGLEEDTGQLPQPVSAVSNEEQS